VKTRRQFLAAAASAGALLAAPAGAQTTAPPKAAATPTPAPRKVSEAAQALAARMRTFDAKLTDEELATIAEGIDGNLSLGRAVNPKGTAIPNSVEPATAFRVIES
jgi:hypothetical protein